MATSSYMDDVYVNENVASSRRFKEHLERSSLVCKAPEPLVDVVNVLELHVSGDGEKLRWRRGRDVPEVQLVIARVWSLSMSGNLVDHFPVCSWLRVVAAAIKRRVTSVTSGWDDEVRDVTLRCMITETMERVIQDDPVRGDWCVNGMLAHWSRMSPLRITGPS